MARIHRTAQGRSLDMSALRAKNEKVRAVGNMRVNARGDVIDSEDKIINDSTRRVNEQYMKSFVRTNVDKSFTARPDRPMTPTVDEAIVKPGMIPVVEEVDQLTEEELEFEQQDEEIVIAAESKKTKK